MNISYKLRAAQLDLARQIETLDFIKSYIRILSESKFNTLFLYVEWRIRTKTFDIGAEKGYNASEIREIIDYAKEYGLDVIPGLASLGHAELLLERPEFKDFAELRDGNVGRWQTERKIDLCPSNPQVQEFLTNYFMDIAAIFDSEYIHIGGDEVWDFNYCPQCQAKAPTFELEQKLYLEHIKFCRSIVVDKLGKKMMIWDDMFELYEDILPLMPKDIILVNWQYQNNLCGYRGHFRNCIFFNQHKLYGDLELSYIVAPADYSISNIVTTTKFSEGSTTFGGLLTLWEKKFAFVHKYLPIAMVTGLLWSKEADSECTACEMMCEKIFGITEPLFVGALTAYLQDISRQYYSGFNALSTYNFHGPDNLVLAFWKSTYSLLSSYQERCKDSFSTTIFLTILEDIRESIFDKSCKLHTFERLNGLAVSDSFEYLMEEFDAIEEMRLASWQKLRPNIDNSEFVNNFKSWRSELQKFNEEESIQGVVKVLFVLSDSYGAQFFSITLIDEDANELVVAKNMVIKEGEAPNFYRCFFVDRNFSLNKVRIECRGYGGQGVAFVAADLACGEYTPTGINNVSGAVTHPEAVLNNDITYAFMGDMNIGNAFRYREQSTLIHTLELTMGI